MTKMSDTYRILCLSTALSPITHMMGVEGNEAILNRQAIMTPTGRRFIPVLSGNAIRHRAVREPAGRHLIETSGMNGELSKRSANFYLHGGALTESNTRVDLAAKLEMQEKIPFVRLLGGSLPASIEEGSLRVDQGVLVCRENAKRVEAMSGMDVPGNLRPAEDFVSGWQYTRSDATKTAAAVIHPKAADADEKSNLMIYAGQGVIPGATFVHGFTLCHAGELEIGALLLALSIWQASGGTVGGMSARGHGRLQTRIMLPERINAQQAIDRYMEHVAKNAEWTKVWTDTIFSPNAKKEKKAKAKKGADDATAESNM